MNKSLLKLVAENIRREPHMFDMCKWGPGNNTCDTPRCICGWAVSLAGGRHQDEPYSNAGKRVLCIDQEQANKLFYTLYWPEPFRTQHMLAGWDNQREAEIAYERIMHFIRTGE